MKQRTQISGSFPVACFGPPLTDTLLSTYTSLINSQPAGELRDALLSCYNCVMAWWNAPESTEKPTHWAFRDKLVPEIPLSKELLKQLDSTTPWLRELDTLSNSAGTGLFDNLEGDLRNCAFHLLWYAKEISLDREPMSMDKLPA